jgi:hypothetical protein
MFDTFRFGVLLGCVLTFFAAPASASIRITNLSDAVAQSETIAIVKLVEYPGEGSPQKPRLNVSRVLKGHLQTGVQEVNFAQYEYPDGPRGEFVAFLDKDRRWKFTAAPLRGRNLDSDVLLVSTFGNLNSRINLSTHLILPGYLSLSHLTAYLKTGRLVYSFSGPVCLPQAGKIAWAPSSLRMEGTYDAVRKSVHVTGLGQLAGFPAVPSVDLTTPVGIPSLSLTYSDRSDRPLVIGGVVEGLDQKTGALIARFSVTAPDVLNEATLKKYLADPRLGRCSYKFRLRCLSTKDYPKLDLSLTLPGDSEDRLEGWGNGPLEIESLGVEAAEPPGGWRFVFVAREGRTVMLDFNLAATTGITDANWWRLPRRGVQSELLYSRNSGPVHGTLWLKDGKALRKITSFSVDVDPVTFGPVSGK